MNKPAEPNSFRTGPDEQGMFGIFGGRFVAETLMPLILDLEQAWSDAKNDPSFQAELDDLNRHYTGRPSPLYFAEQLTRHLGGAKVYFKRDELNHTGSHKINNCLGQILLAKRMGKTRIIAETGAGQHGVASATVAARFGFPCVVYMGSTDIERQAPNVFRMKLLGAEVNPVTSGNGTLKDAMNEALRDWVTNVESTYYLIGTAAGPHPYPELGARFPVGDRHRRHDSRCSKPKGGCRTCLSPPSAAAPTRSGCSIRSSTTRMSPSWGRARRQGSRRRRALCLADRRPGGRAAWQPDLSAAGRRRADQRRAFDFGRARLSGHRPGTFLAQGNRAGRLCPGDGRRSA